LIVRIYIAGPYTAPTLPEIERNVMHALDAGVAIMQRGHDAYVPYLTHWLDQHAKRRGIELPNTYWYDYDEPHLMICEGLYRLDGASTGADREQAWMAHAGRPVWTRLEDIPTAYQWESTPDRERLQDALDLTIQGVGEAQGQTALHAFLAGMIYLAALHYDPRIGQMAREILTVDLSQNHRLNELVKETGVRAGSHILTRGLPV
jgi:hypothetical protein